MRVQPTVTITCHVCGSVFTVNNRAGFVDGKRVFEQTPSACPACGASIKGKAETGVGGAHDLLLWVYAAPWYRRTYADIDRLLDVHVRNQADLDAYVALIDAMDYDAWERQVREQAGGKLTRDDRDELAIIQRARDDARAGTLLGKFEEATRASRERLRQEHEKHMRVFESRRG
jgi:hypothetical protein